MSDTVLPIYLDYNASAPLDPRVLEAMAPYFEAAYGNSRSGHAFGRRLQDAIAVARAQVARMIGAQPHEITLTSGGSEANNLALKGLFWARPERRHLVVSALEHYSVAYAADFLVTIGARLSVLPVDGRGHVDPAAVLGAIAPDTLLVAVQHANNEIGTVQDIAAIASHVRACGTHLHCDAAQSAGKLPIDVNAMGVDTLTLAAHKFGGPTGVGALYARDGVGLVPLVHGAGHEAGLRSGTHATALIVGMGHACELVVQGGLEDARRMAALRDRLYARLQAEFPGLHRNGDPAASLPHTLNVSFPGLDGGELLAGVPEIAATTGAACHSGSREPSMALRAIAAPLAIGIGAVRLSLGRHTTEEEIDRAAHHLGAAARGLSSEPEGVSVRGLVPG